MVNIATLYVLDQYEKAVGVIDNRLKDGLQFFEDLLTTKLEYGYMDFQFSIKLNHPKASMIQKEYHVVVPDEDGKHLLFRIKSLKRNTKTNVLEVWCEGAASTDLLSSILRPIKLNSTSLENAMNIILANTDWIPGQIDFAGVKDIGFDYTNSFAAIQEVATAFEAEIEYEVVFDGLKISKKLVHMLERRGSDTKKLFRYGQDIEGIEIEEDTKNIFTAIVPVGTNGPDGKPFTLDGYTPSSIEEGYEKKSNWIGSIEAFQNYHLNGKHRFYYFSDDKAQSQAELFQNGLAELKKISKTNDTYSMGVILLERLSGLEAHRVRLGDTIRVDNRSSGVLAEARVSVWERSLTDRSKSNVTLAEYVNLYPSLLRKISQLQSSWTDASIASKAAFSNLDATQAGFTTLYVDQLFSPTVVSYKNEDITFTFDPLNGDDIADGISSPKKTLSALFQSLPRFNDAIINIDLVGTNRTFYENPELKGIVGAGTVNINLGTLTNKLVGRMFIKNCTNTINMSNANLQNQTLFTTDLYEGTLNIINSSAVFLNGIYIDSMAGAKLKYAILGQSSYVRISSSEAYNGADAQLVLQYGARGDLYTGGLKGVGGTNGVLVSYSSILGGLSTAYAPKPSITTANGGICNVTFNNSYTATSPGAPATKTYTTTWTATNTASWNVTNSYWRTDNNYLYMGNYGYGNWKGVAFFDSQNMREVLANSSIKSVEIYLSRTKGGSNAAQYLNLHTHNITSTTSTNPVLTLIKNNAAAYAIGDYGWFSAPTLVGEKLRDNTAQGIAIFDSDGSPYMVFSGGSNVKIRITYEK